MTPREMSHRSFEEPCPDYVGLLVRAADNALDAAGRARLDAHLAGCAACSRALDTQQMAHVLLAEAYEIEPPLGFSTRVLAHLDIKERWFDRLDFRQWTWRVAPVAAGLLLAASLAVAAGQPAEAIAALHDASAADGAAESAVLLSDVMNETDLVTLLWEAETSAQSLEEVTP